MPKYISILLLLCLFYNVTCTTRSLQGPFKVTSITIRNCSAKEVTRPHKDYGSFAKYHTEVYNSSGKIYIRANYTILKTLESVKARVRSFIWEDNQWRLRLLIPGFGCQREIFRLFLQVINWTVDPNKCSIAKGSGAVNRIEVNKFQHAWESETEYGRWMWVYEAMSKGKTALCAVLETMVTPLEKSEKAD